MLPATTTRPKPVAMLIHGSGGDARVWDCVIPLFKDISPYPIDMPGHGLSSEAPLETIAACADHVESIRAASGCQSIYLVGHSLGGAIAQAYAQAFPDHCRGLVIASSGPTFSVAESRIEAIEMDFASQIDHFAAGQLSPTASADLKSKARDMVARRKPSAFAQDLKLCRQFDSRAWLHDIATPALVITGANDTMTPVEGSREVAEQLPDARLLIMEPAGHCLMLEQAHLFAACVDAFVHETELLRGTKVI